MLVLLGMGAVLVNSFVAQGAVLSKSEATNSGQLFGMAIEKAMRNAEYSTVSPDGTVLKVQTTFNANDDIRHCQAFRLGDGTAEVSLSADSVLTPVWETWLAEGDGREWTVIIRQDGLTPFFAQTNATQPNGGVRYVFDIETESAPVIFRGEVRPEWQPGADRELTCWS